MGKRGPPPKPSALKELEGTYRADRAARNEMRLPVKAPRCPKWLGEVARAEWRRVVPQLVKTGVLAFIDGATLEGYCASYARAIAAEAEVEKEGLTVTGAQGGIIANPACTIARNEWAQVRKFAAEFGLTPSARSRISVPSAEPEDKAESDLFQRPALVALKGGSGG